MGINESVSSMYTVHRAVPELFTVVVTPKKVPNVFLQSRRAQKMPMKKTEENELSGIDDRVD